MENRLIKKTLLSLLILVIGCNKEDFADLNTDPSQLVEPNLTFSVAKSIELMHNEDYLVWFYNNFDYSFTWGQLTAVGNGNSEDLVTMGPYSNQRLYPKLYANVRDIRKRIDEKNDKDRFKALKAMTFPILIQPYITVTDNQGSIPYTEAAMAAYTSPPLIRPKYDNQALLFDTWLEELNQAILDLSSSEQFEIGNQDVIYGGDYTKWAKYCNLLKLKIAARLINKDRSRALKIAEEVANSSVGYMDELTDDFIYRRDENYTGTGNGTQPGDAAKKIIDFMIENKDPRARFIFTKNQFNAEVVQAFIDAGKDLPAYIDQYVNKDGSGNFISWKSPGEPWVRYFGVPLSPDAKFDSSNDSYFKQGELNKITLDGIERTYRSTSAYSERITRTKIAFSYPTKPGGRVIEKKDNYPSLQVVLGSSSETNLYLAEFKLLGANLPNSAQDYFNKGVELSLKRLDLLAKNNGQPYYEKDPVYVDETEATNAATKLKPYEITQLLAQPAYDLGTDGLEKVYIQQYINFAATPNDFWTLVRRSGIPKKSSLYFPSESMLASGNELVFPRRYTVGTPTEDNANYVNALKAVKEQGFTTGSNDPQVLNNERLWFDKENPGYGEGPKQ